MSGSSLKSPGELCKYTWSISSHPFSARIYQNGGGWEGGGYFGKRSPDASVMLPWHFSNHPTLLQRVTLLVSDQSLINKLAVSVCNAAGQPGSSAYNPTHLKQTLEIGASVLPEPSVL